MENTDETGFNIRTEVIRSGVYCNDEDADMFSDRSGSFIAWTRNKNETAKLWKELSNDSGFV
jgi:hypothetical protein